MQLYFYFVQKAPYLKIHSNIYNSNVKVYIYGNDESNRYIKTLYKEGRLNV